MNTDETESKTKETDRRLRARALILSRKTEDEEMESDSLHLLAFALGQERFGIETGCVLEIQPLAKQNWSPVPCTPGFILGAVNIRGRIYSIMDIGRFLGLPPRTISDKEHVLLIRGGNQGKEGEVELCLLTDDLPEVVAVAISHIRPVPATLTEKARKFVRGVTGEMLAVIDTGRLLSDTRIVIDEEA